MLPPSSPPLPRPHRRGLIEARTWCKTPCARMPLFRGLTAAASLKLDNSTVHLNAKRRLFRGLTAAASLKPLGIGVDFAPVRRPLPRPHRRGLIEATTAPTRASGMARLFRGLTAAASLKPSMPRTDWQPPSPLFRGLTAAASLKPRLGVLRGLPRQGSSAASPPRPH